MIDKQSFSNISNHKMETSPDESESEDTNEVILYLDNRRLFPRKY